MADKPTAPPKSERDKRLAAALRDNLRRRKSQARAFAGQGGENHSGPVLSGPAHRPPPADKA